MNRAQGRGAARALLLGLPLALLLPGLTACESQSPPASSPSPTVRTLTPVPLPPPGPPSGRIRADLRQSSRDAALGRIQVWVDNDTARDLEPIRISYVDPRFPRPVLGQRLRLDPSQSERGYPLPLPRNPRCDDADADADSDPDPGPPTFVRIDMTGSAPVRVRVSDANEVVERYVTARCLELAVARVARLSFSDTVRRASQGGSGVLTLVVRPTGRTGHRLRIDSVGGTPLLGAAGRSAWRPDTLVPLTGPVTRVPLRVRPARCDDHVFLEAAGATAFLVRLHLDGRPGQIVVRMSPRGARHAIAFARASCGR